MKNGFPWKPTESFVLNSSLEVSGSFWELAGKGSLGLPANQMCLKMHQWVGSSDPIPITMSIALTL